MVKIVYNAPNRAPHYSSARDLYDAGVLKTFVCGFSRLSPRAPFPEIGNTLRRVDQLQTLYVASLKLKMPQPISDELAYLAKLQIDKGSRTALQGADVFVYYNGCGLESARWFGRNGGINIVEVVNCHVQHQEQLMAEEHKRLGLPWRPFHGREVKRRVTEVEEADYVLLPSRFVARSLLAKGIPSERLLRVPYRMENIPGSTSAISPKTVDDGTFRVLYVGSISVRKGLVYLIEAFRQLKHPKKELWLVGPMSTPSGLENISLPEGTKFFGPLKGDALKQAYTSATVFCLPSIEDGFGLVVNEALIYGLPVVTTENTGAEELLSDGKGGTVVPIRDSSAIADYFTRLAEDRDFLALQSREAAEKAVRLKAESQNSASLSATLIKAFEQHSTKVCKSN